MPITAFVEKMLDNLSKRTAPTSGDPETFRRFGRAVGRQLRRPYLARHSHQSAADHVAELWERISVRTSDTPDVAGHMEGELAVFTTVMRDQPFIVDTLRLGLTTFGATYTGNLNVVVSTRRDEAGRIVEVDQAYDPLESVTRIEAEGIAAESLATVVAGLAARLRLAQHVVADFQSMTDLVETAALRFNRLADRMPDQADGLREAAELLRWLLSDNFVFMGAISDEGSLGIARATAADAWDVSSLSTGWSASSGRVPVQIRKGLLSSAVHRYGRVDELRIEIPGGGAGESRVLLFQGLFTYRAVTQPSRHVPVLRRVLAEMLQKEESKPGSYRYKGVANVFDALPIEYLFTATAAEISDVADRVLEAEQEHVVRIHVSQNADASSTFALLAMPRERWTDQLRVAIEELLVSASGATACDHGVFLGRFQTMLVYYSLTGTHALSEGAREAILAEVTARTTPWDDAVYGALTALVGVDTADDLVFTYGDAFPDGYRQKVTPASAAEDIVQLTRLAAGSTLELDLSADRDGTLHLRAYQAQHIILSDILPVLDKFGLVVEDQWSDTVTPEGGAKSTIDTFRLRGVSGLSSADILDRKQILIEGVKAVVAKKMVDDGLNRILLRSNIPWEAVDLFRAYLGYARQLGLPCTAVRAQELLLSKAELVTRLWEVFQARFNPALEGDRSVEMAKANEAYQDALREVSDNDQDVIFRTLYNLVDSSIRTNFYRTDRVEHYISFKVEHARVKQMPSPRMLFEIYVHHRDVEGLHLRGGKVARGGIRWSDRDDFRREVLGLVNTQMVKNVVIVPEGSKGGFFMKHSPVNPADKRRRADELYQIFIRGLLDVTDNIVAGTPVGPPNVVRHDDADPYLVVAADKGTAHLSDTANRLSQSYGFWLDDAFASGGSNGYDHKVVGITARGGWETVHRHFAEMGINPHTTEFTCAGIGDTSGDVFGNGVIAHPKMRLVAAFNHLHIFLDPNPDCAASFAERNRLFREVKGWEAYDTSIISAGGGIFSRKAKSIPLSPALQALLGTTATELPSDAVVRAILRLDVDLMWNGGIGTYWKASFETHQEAGDPANDEVRADAPELRCKIVGEGGNLGFTQAGRHEYAMLGGRLNTDAIDNSGGVDMSDHEVNLKILLNPMVAAGRMTREERNVLIESLTEDVAADVLHNNDLHGRLLSLDQVRSQRDPIAWTRTIDFICKLGNVTAQFLRLPSEDDLKKRAAAHLGLSRPELAVIQAHVKMHLFRQLKDADGSSIPGFKQKVLDYFPDRIKNDFAADVPTHMLHQSIAMTVVCNEVVNEAGAVFLPLLLELTGASPVAVATAWSHAMTLVDAWGIRAEIEASPSSPIGRYHAWVGVTDAVQSLVSIWLSAGEPGPEKESKAGIQAALRAIGNTRGTVHEARILARVEALTSKEIPLALAQKVALLGEVAVAREVALLAGPGDVDAVLTSYLAAGEASRLLSTVRSLEARPAQSAWDPVAIGIVRNRYIRLVRELVSALPVTEEAKLGVDAFSARLARVELASLQELVGQILGDQPELAALLVADERIRAWIGRLGR